MVLAIATAVAPLHRRSLARVPLALLVVGLLMLAFRETWGGLYFLRWGPAALVLLAVAFGAVAPRLAVLALGVTVAALPSVVGYLTAPTLHHAPVVIGVAAAGLALGTVLPLAHLTRRRLT